MKDWKKIAAPYASYEVSSDGDVRRGGSIMKGVPDRDGYLNINLSHSNRARKFKVHRLVCEAFHGPCPEGMECAHLDGNPQNNQANNLRWTTRSANNRMKSRHGTHQDQRGENHPRVKLSDADAVEIRTRFANGESGNALSKEFGIGSAHASRIIRGEVRKEAGGPQG